MTGAFSQQLGKFMVTARNQTGSTAPINTVWATNSLFGTHVGASASVATAAVLEVHDVHTNPINASTSTSAPYVMLSADNSAFASCMFCVGVQPDMIVNFPAGTTGQNTSGFGNLTIGPQSNAIASHCSAATENIGRDCAKIFTAGTITMYGQAGNNQTPETASDIANCSDYNTSSYPIIFAQYAGGKNSGGVFVDETTHTYLINNSPGGTGACFFYTQLFRNQSQPTIQFGTEMRFEDLVGAGNGTNPSNMLRLFGSPGTQNGMEWQSFNSSLQQFQTPFSMFVNPATGQGQLKVSQLTLNTGVTPTVALGSAAGTSPTGQTIIGGNLAFTLQFVAGTTPAANGIVATVTFTNGPLPATPSYCWGLPANAATQPIGIAYGTSISQTGFVLNIGATALTAGKTYKFGVGCN